MNASILGTCAAATVLLTAAAASAGINLLPDNSRFDTVVADGGGTIEVSDDTPMSTPDIFGLLDSAPDQVRQEFGPSRIEIAGTTAGGVDEPEGSLVRVVANVGEGTPEFPTEITLLAEFLPSPNPNNPAQAFALDATFAFTLDAAQPVAFEVDAPGLRSATGMFMDIEDEHGVSPQGTLVADTTYFVRINVPEFDIDPQQPDPDFRSSMLRIRVDEETFRRCIPWDNGEPDFGAAQAVQRIDSPTHGQPFESLVADDFLFKKNDFFCIDSIDVWLAASSSAPTPTANIMKLDLYVDCNGRPGELAATLTSQAVHAQDIFSGIQITGPLPGMPFGPDIDIFRVRFNLDEFSEHFAPFRDNLYSEPLGYQRFWLAPYVQSEAGGIGSYFWITSNFIDPATPDNTKTVQGVQAQYRSAAFGFNDWTDGDDASCCFPGCADFAFRINGDCCELAFETTPPKFSDIEPPYDPAAVPFGIPSSLPAAGPRAADDFQICPSVDERFICRIEAWLATNCDEDQLAEVILELYANECDTPTKVNAIPSDPSSELEPIAVLRNPKVTPIDESLGGLDVYKVIFEKPASPALEGGRNYWLALVGPDTTTSPLTESLFLFSNRDRIDPDTADCVDQLEPAHAKDQFLNILDFTPITDPDVAALIGLAMPEHRDLAFRVFLIRDGAFLLPEPPMLTSPTRGVAPGQLSELNPNTIPAQRRAADIDSDAPAPIITLFGNAAGN